MFRRIRDARDLIAELEKLIERSRPIPLTDDVGLDERSALRLVRGLARTDEVATDPLLRDAVERLAARIRAAPAIPLTGKRRLDQSTVRAAVAELRSLADRQ